MSSFVMGSLIFIVFHDFSVLYHTYHNIVCGFVPWKNSVLKFNKASHLKKFLFIVKPWDLTSVDFFFFNMAAPFFLSRTKVWYHDVLLYRYRVDRKERARLKNVKFTGKTSEKVKHIYIQSIELQLSSNYLHVNTVIIKWLNAYSTTFWLLYMLLSFKEKKLHVQASSIFCSQTNGNVQHMNSNEKKKKNFSFSKRFPFMKSKDHAVGEDISADERK